MLPLSLALMMTKNATLEARTLCLLGLGSLQVLMVRSMLKMSRGCKAAISHDLCIESF